MRECTLHLWRQVASAQLKHQDKDPCTQPLEHLRAIFFVLVKSWAQSLSLRSSSWTSSAESFAARVWAVQRDEVP